MARQLSLFAVVFLATSLFAAPCCAQEARATAAAFVGDVEGPADDYLEGGYAALARKSNNQPEFGNGSAAATTVGSDISVSGEFTSKPTFTWTAGGSGSFMSHDTVQVIDHNYHAGDQYFIRFFAVLNWNLSGEEFGFRFTVNNQTSDWDSISGIGQNDFQIAPAGVGFKRAVVDIDLTNLAAVPNVQSLYNAKLPFSAEVTASARTRGGSGKVKASLHTTKPDLLKRPAGGGQPFVLHPFHAVQIESQSGEGDTFTGDPTAIGLNPMSADFDLDGEVNGNDFLIWQRNVTTEFGAEQADGNATLREDGDVNGLDLDIWKQQFGMPSGAASATIATPEPLGSLLAGLAVLGGVHFRRRRRYSNAVGPPHLQPRCDVAVTLSRQGSGGIVSGAWRK